MWGNAVSLKKGSAPRHPLYSLETHYHASLMNATSTAFPYALRLSSLVAHGESRPLSRTLHHNPIQNIVKRQVRKHLNQNKNNLQETKNRGYLEVFNN